MGPILNLSFDGGHLGSLINIKKKKFWKGSFKYSLGSIMFALSEKIFIFPTNPMLKARSCNCIHHGWPIYTESQHFEVSS